MPTYSFGEDSPLKFQISDKLAALYNEAVSEYFKAQTRFNQKFGRQWDPLSDPIAIRWSRKQKKAWNEFGRIMKNVVSAASVTVGGRGRAITFAVATGALYGYLRGR